MKLFFALNLILLLNNCSFDNKTGIWKSEEIIVKADNIDKSIEGFEKISKNSNTFDQVVVATLNKDLNLPSPKTNLLWNDIFYNKTNNTLNFNYNETNRLIFESKKISKYKINEYILFEEENLITSDIKGNLIVYSIKKNKVVRNFNFYKKKYKKFNKYLNLYVKDGIIYVSDNIGYLYAYDYKNGKIVWAKDYKIPFRSNLKISKNKLMTSNQNNSLFFFDKNSGEILKLIPTEETIVKKKFKNNLSLNDNSLFFINTFGSLYSISIDNFRINWFININEIINSSPGSLFDGGKILIFENKLIISSAKFTYIIDILNGSILYKINFSSNITPIVIDNHLISITKKNLLVALNLSNGEVFFSSNIRQDIKNFLKVKKFNFQIKKINILSNKIYIFLNNSNLLIYNFKGELKEIKKFPTKINFQPIFLNNSIVSLNSKNKLLVID